MSEPERIKDEELAQVLDELKRREPIFHRPEFGTSLGDFENMTAEDFWEVGASGRRYSRTYVLNTLDQRSRNPKPDVWETTDFQCRQLAERVYLLTYTLTQENIRVTRRSTIWEANKDGWKILYHQGTLVQDPG